MKKLWLVAPLLALSGCGAAEVASTGMGVAGLFLGSRPAAPVVIDGERLKSANKRAKEAYASARMASRRGAIPPTVDQDTARPNFCEMVVADLAVVSDAGGKASALICLIDHHLDRAQAAFETGAVAAYADNLAKADSLTDQLTALIRAADEGTAP